MKTLELELSQREALESGHLKILVDPKAPDTDGDEVKLGDTVKAEGKEYAVLHVQPVTTGYVHEFKRNVNGKPVKTSKTVNGRKLILTLELIKGNVTSGKKEPSDKATAKA